MFFKGLKPILALGLMVICFGCAKKNDDAPVSYQTLRYNYADARMIVSSPEGGAANNSVGTQVVKHANTAMGTPYVYGGTRPGGFDCSGLVMWAYNRAGVALPRTAREQSAVGVKITKQEDMRAGDIVTFKHPKRGYHTGIYIGDGKFIHSPRTNSHVKVSSLQSDYFKNILIGARRVSFDCNNILLTDAGNNLETYIEKRGYAPVEKSAPAPKKVIKKSIKKNSKKVEAKKAKKGSHTIASKNSKNSSQKIALRKPVVKAKAKSLAQNQKPAKATTAAKSSSKKGTQKAVSLLHKKTR